MIARISTKHRGSKARRFFEPMETMVRSGDVQALGRVLAYGRALLTAAEIERDIRANWLLTEVFGANVDPQENTLVLNADAGAGVGHTTLALRCSGSPTPAIGAVQMTPEALGLSQAQLARRQPRTTGG